MTALCRRAHHDFAVAAPSQASTYQAVFTGMRPGDRSATGGGRWPSWLHDHPGRNPHVKPGLMADRFTGLVDLRQMEPGPYLLSDLYLHATAIVHVRARAALAVDHDFAPWAVVVHWRRQAAAILYVLAIAALAVGQLDLAGRAGVWGQTAAVAHVLAIAALAVGQLDLAERAGVWGPAAAVAHVLAIAAPSVG
jgi:hypothetical protein